MVWLMCDWVKIFRISKIDQKPHETVCCALAYRTGKLMFKSNASCTLTFEWHFTVDFVASPLFTPHIHTNEWATKCYRLVTVFVFSPYFGNEKFYNRFLTFPLLPRAKAVHHLCVFKRHHFIIYNRYWNKIKCSLSQPLPYTRIFSLE